MLPGIGFVFDELVHICVNGETISATPTHPFYVDKLGWTLARSLRAGDILVLSNGELVTVEWVQHEILESPIKVYNFEVEDFHTYFVGECGVLVHNDCNTGKYKELRGEEGKESHHIIQNASVKDMPGYSSSNAPAISLEGPSTRMGTEHYKATQFQSHNNYGGTYGDERKVAYISLRKAGKTKEEAFQAINYADKYFVGELGWDFTTITSIPKNRR